MASPFPISLPGYKCVTNVCQKKPTAGEHRLEAGAKGSSLPTVPSHLIIVIVQVICQKESKMGFTQALLCSLSSACPASRPAPQHPWIWEVHPVLPPPCPRMTRLSPGTHPCCSSPGASTPTRPHGAAWNLTGPGASWHTPVVPHRT